MAKVLQWPARVETVVFDVDRTLYSGADGDSYIKHGTIGELEFLTGFLRTSSVEETKQILREKRASIGAENGGGLSSISHAVFALGVTPEIWNVIRDGCYHPEDFLRPNPELIKLMKELPVRLAAATNSPRGVGRRVLETLGMSEMLKSGRMKVFGPEDCGCAKPDPRMYAVVASLLDVPLGTCVSFGDHEYKDCTMALEAGYGGAVVISDTADLMDFLRSANFNGEERL